MCFKFYKKTISLNANQEIALIFLLIIIIGTFLLSLPFSTKAAGSCGILTALFTSTSAVCVTGLSLVDVYSSFSFWGQLIILILMEIGGLGFMSIISILFYITRHNNDIQSLSLIAESLGSDGLKHIGRIQKRLLIGSFSFELIGALILSSTFIPSFGIKDGIWFGIFHSVSAFCNAGFDLMGINTPGCGLVAIQNNNIALITIALLIIIGGIGFIVWDDIADAKNIRHWSVYTKMVISTSAFLILSGSILFMVFEFNNPKTISDMPFINQIVNSFFQSVTPRTAGFASISQNDLSDKSIILTIILMIIGGSAGSTAGGIKTITFLIIVCALFLSVFGRKSTVIMHRTISNEQILHAYTVAGSFILLTIAGSFIISCSSGISFIESYFESVSALATVGLSLGVTDSLSIASQLIIIAFMYIGRVGLLTLTVGFFKTKDLPSIKYPSAHLIIG